MLRGQSTQCAKDSGPSNGMCDCDCVCNRACAYEGHVGIHASTSRFWKIVPKFFFEFLQVKNLPNQPTVQIKLSYQFFDYEGHIPWHIR